MTTPPGSPSPALRPLLNQIASGAPLSAAQARELFGGIMAGLLPDAVVGGVLLALRTRGESADEIAGAVTALRDVMQGVSHAAPDTLVDTCGTGGGDITTINLSTAAAFVAAGAGVPIAKHGNRSFTSRSGSADVLEALGIGIDTTPESAAAILADVGLVFLFAPAYHPAMRHVTPVRRALGVPTIMNLIGPLANPAGVRRQVVGVADRDRAPMMAQALARLDTLHAWVVRGEIGMDEISPLGLTRVWEVRGGEVTEWMLDPADLGLDAPSLAGLEGGEPEENAARLLDLFASPERAAPALRAAVLLNATAAILVAGVETTTARAADAARAALGDGRALQRLEALRRASPVITPSGLSTSG